MGGYVVIAILAATAVYLALKSERDRERRVARARQHRALMARVGYAGPKAGDGPRDAIPAGYPGYPGSIYLIHYGESEDSDECADEDHFFACPEEMGVDAKAVGWTHFRCGCGKEYDGRYEHGPQDAHTVTVTRTDGRTETHDGLGEEQAREVEVGALAEADVLIVQSREN